MCPVQTVTHVSGRSPDFLLAAWSQLHCNPFRRTAAKSLAYVVTAYDQVLPVVGAAAHQHVDMRIVGIPVFDGDPVECRAEVALGIGHELAGEGAKIGHLDRILGGDGEPEMMPVLFAPFDKSLGDGVVGAGVEQARVRAIAGDALALEVCDVLGERRRTKAAAAVAHDPAYDDTRAGRAGGKG